MASPSEPERNKTVTGYPAAFCTVYGQPPPPSYVAPPPPVAFATRNRRFPPPPTAHRSPPDKRLIYFLLVLSICVLLYYICTAPTYPNFQIKSATLHDSNQNWDIDLLVVNPNKRQQIKYNNVQVEIVYGHEHGNDNYALRGGARLPDFYQDSKANKTMLLRAEVLGVRATSALEVLDVTFFVSVRFSGWCWPQCGTPPTRVVCNGIRLGISKATGDIIGGPSGCVVGLA